MPTTGKGGGGLGAKRNVLEGTKPFLTAFCYRTVSQSLAKQAMFSILKSANENGALSSQNSIKNAFLVRLFAKKMHH